MIVVLAIIALIAVPIVLNIIEKARRGAAISSARSYIKATETYVLTTELNKKDTLKKNNKYNVTKETTIEEKTYSKINDLVEIKGTKPSGSEDYITLGESYQVVEAKLTINGYEILIKNDEVISITYNGKVEETEDDNNETVTISPTSGSVEIGKTLQLTATVTGNSDKTVTWTSSDEEVATVDSTGLVTGVKGGSVVITATTVNGKSVIANITVIAKTESLATQAQVGDYVAYDVSPNSVTCDGYSTSLKGWRVLKIVNNQVYLVHAGIPECYYHGTDQSASITALNNLAQKYINNAYAESAHAMTRDEALAITGSENSTSNNLRATGASYWLASPYDTSHLRYVNTDGVRQQLRLRQFVWCAPSSRSKVYNQNKWKNNRCSRSRSMESYSIIK